MLASGSKFAEEIRQLRVVVRREQTLRLLRDVHVGDGPDLRQAPKVFVLLPHVIGVGQHPDPQVSHFPGHAPAERHGVR